MEPASAHGEAEYQAFFTKATEIHNSEEAFNYDFTRILNTTWQMAKNDSNLLIHGRAWGSLEKWKGGAVATCEEVFRRGGDALKDTNGKALVISCSNARIRGLAWRHDATVPFRLQ